MKITLNMDDWNNWLKTKGLALRTIKEYNRYLSGLDLDNISQSAIIAFLQRNNNSMCHALINNFLEYINVNEYPDEIKASIGNISLPKIKGRKKRHLPDVLDEEQITDIAKAMITERDAIMLLISFYGGLRVSELVNIKPYDFKWDAWVKNPGNNGSLKVTGKGDKQRIVFIPKDLMKRTYQWIKSISKGRSKNEKLFMIGIRRWSYILDRASNKAIHRHINAHLTRHSCFTWLRNNGWDLDEIKLYAGHESIATTQIYAQLSQVKLKGKFDDLLKGS